MHADPRSETRSANFYVPRDEEFSEEKMTSFITKTAGSVLNAVLPSLEAILTDLGFSAFIEIDELYNQGIPITKLKDEGLLRGTLARVIRAVTDGVDDVVRFEAPDMYKSKKKPSTPPTPPPPPQTTSPRTSSSSSADHEGIDPFDLNLQRTNFLGFGMRNSHAKLLLALTPTA